MVFGPWGNEVAATTQFSGTWLQDPEDPAGTVIKLAYGALGREVSIDRAKTALQFVGRPFPVYDVGEARAESLQVETTLNAEEDGDAAVLDQLDNAGQTGKRLTAKQMLKKLRALVGDSNVILYRDARGRKMYAVASDFTSKDVEKGSYEVSFLLSRVDYDEALPDPVDVPVETPDLQVKNLQSTVDTQSSSIFLDWDDVTNATLYKVYLDGVEVAAVDQSATTYGPLDPGSYTVWVTAMVAGVEGPASVAVGFVIEEDPEVPPPPSTVPQNFKAFPQANNSVNFTWDAVPGATSYKLYEIRSPSGVSGGTYTGTSATRGSPTPLANGSFDYWLTATVNGVESGISNHQQFSLPYDGGPIGGGTGGGGTETLPNPVQVLGLGTGDGQLHYNLGAGFREGHVNITPTELYAWNTTTGNVKKLVDENWVFTKRDVSGNVVVSLEAPRDGGTTSTNTEYARMEFREQDEDGDGNISFNPLVGLHYHEGFSRIDSMTPLKRGVCINQYHDAAGDTVMIKTKNASSGSGMQMVLDVRGTQVKVLDTNVQVGELIWSRLEMDNGFLRVYYIKGGAKTSTPIHSESYSDATNTGWYHKFGDYLQSNENTDSTGRIIVSVHGWKQFHTGWPTPLDPTVNTIEVSAGADAAVTVGGSNFTRTAIEVGPGINSRQWKLQTSVTGGPAAGTVLSTTAALSWAIPSTPGSYTLRYTGTNTTTGASDFDDVIVTVNPVGGGGSGTLVYPETFKDGTPYFTISEGNTIVNVSGTSALVSALAAAVPGQRIRLASGAYTGQTYNVSSRIGTSANGNGITIESAVPLGAVFGAGTKWVINNSKHVKVIGLDIPHDAEGDTLQIRGNSEFVAFSRCRVGPSTFTNKTIVGNYLYVGDDVKNFRVDHNTFRNKGSSGNVVRVYGNFTTFKICSYGRIDHNLIDTVGDEVGNDKEVFRIGVSTMSRTLANINVERNVVVNAKAEPEVFSNKADNIQWRGNVILTCAGGMVLRHGRNCTQQSNYIIDRQNTTASAGLGSGGNRTYDSGHIIEDNYADGLSGPGNFQYPFQLDSGDAGGSSTNLSAHWNVIDVILRRNVVVNCTKSIAIGDNYGTAPQSCDVQDNDVINSGTAAITNVGGMTLGGDSTSTNNEFYASTAAAGYTADARGIFRKAGRGPKVTYLLASEVGVTGDVNDSDRTGIAV
jgi:hypothetical protein